jgi:predicted RNA-binding protein with PUA-like domain/DNA polymerase III delta prime subunit
MINTDKLRSLLKDYKVGLVELWEGEKFKWEAIKHFQDHWDIQATDFLEMFTKATEKTDSLLNSFRYYPLGMLIDFINIDKEAVRSMFINLYNEDKDLGQRIEEFISASKVLLSKAEDGETKQHYQNLNSISMYLWLRYPDKHYFYKYSLSKKVAQELENPFIPKSNGSVTNLIQTFQMFDEIREEIKKDPELIQLIQSKLTEDFYPDPAFITLTMDVGYYIWKGYQKVKSYSEQMWYPQDYNPQISTEKWEELLQDDSVFTSSNLTIVKRMKDFGGVATCKQLAERYGESANFYNAGSSSLAKRIHNVTGCPLYDSDSGDSKWWPILYTGKHADKETPGSFVWKLRPEISQALDTVDLSDVPLYAKRDPIFWKISHGPKCVPEEARMYFEKKHMVTVEKDTGIIGGAGVGQGENFMKNMRKGDIFYLCYGNSIQLLAEITTDEIKHVDPDEVKLITENPDGWYQREYKVIATSKDTSPYKNKKKWWTPNFNSTCVPVQDQDKHLFEEYILKPYFDRTLNSFSDQLPTKNYWWLNANPKVFSFLNTDIGEEVACWNYNSNGNKRRVFQHFFEVKLGEPIICYETSPLKQIVSLAEVTQENDEEKFCLKKTENLLTPIDYNDLAKQPELQNMEVMRNSQGSLFKLSKEEYDFLMDIIREENPLVSKDLIEPYTAENFLEEVYMPKNDYDALVSILRKKKNLILQGPPGVGKTFAAKRLAYAMMGCKDESRIAFIQFHQNYSYEDFIMGYKPKDNGFELRNGSFYQFCQKASNAPDKDFFFIIDEINRGNLSKIFGELLMLIENEYRGTKIKLAYNELLFTVPQNVFIIGTMNTADRSLAMIDYALRRRFSFFDMEPSFGAGCFKKYQDSLQNEIFNELIQEIQKLNNEIKDDASLGDGFRIGHSYFCNLKNCDEAWIQQVIEFEILPMLQEYWFDESNKVDKWRINLRKVLHDD